MTVQSKISSSVPVGSSSKGPTALLPVPVGNVPSNANMHCPNEEKSWTLNKLEDLKVYTYNTRGIDDDQKLDQLLLETENISWNIIGISETHMKGEKLTKLTANNHLLYHKERRQKIRWSRVSSEQ